MLCFGEASSLISSTSSFKRILLELETYFDTEHLRISELYAIWNWSFATNLHCYVLINICHSSRACHELSFLVLVCFGVRRVWRNEDLSLYIPCILTLQNYAKLALKIVNHLLSTPWNFFSLGGGGIAWGCKELWYIFIPWVLGANFALYLAIVHLELLLLL